jgi:peptidoglycan/xylan/chitin deacetylase (PgdA/CDA1 family)
MRHIAAVALALVLGIGVGYGGWRLWMKSSDLLRPVVVLRNADAATVIEPALTTRIAALTSAVRPPPEDRSRLVVLTFDDGPYPVATPLLLQTLHDLKVPATFFLIGRDAQQFPALTRAIAAGGHEIGDHTLTHPDLDQLSDAAVRSELRGGALALRRIAPQAGESRLFRPPHGRYTLATIQTAQAAGFNTILWTDDPGDWRAIPGDALLAHVVNHATAPEVLLLHSGRIATVSMLPELVARYRASGYRFVTVGTLLRSAAAAELNRPAKISLVLGT